MTYEEIMESLPEDLRKRCGGHPETTEKLYEEGKLTFKLISVKIGDRVRYKGLGTEHIVVGLHPDNNRDFYIDDTDWCYVPWADDWEIVR